MESKPHSAQELCDRVRRGLIEMTEMPDAFDAFLKIERLLEQLEALQEDHVLRASHDEIVGRLHEQLETYAAALTKIALGPSETSPPEIARCALGWPAHGWEWQEPNPAKSPDDG